MKRVLPQFSSELHPFTRDFISVHSLSHLTRWIAGALSESHRPLYASPLSPGNPKVLSRRPENEKFAAGLTSEEQSSWGAWILYNSSALPCYQVISLVWPLYARHVSFLETVGVSIQGFPVWGGFQMFRVYWNRHAWLTGCSKQAWGLVFANWLFMAMTLKIDVAGWDKRYLHLFGTLTIFTLTSLRLRLRHGQLSPIVAKPVIFHCDRVNPIYSCHT